MRYIKNYFFHPQLLTLTQGNMRKKIIFVFFLFQMLGNLFPSIITLKEIFEPAEIKINGEYILINDIKVPKVLLYSTSGKFLASFGTIGEGPGEILSIENFQLFADKVIISDFSKILIFDRASGKLISEIKKAEGVQKVIYLKDNRIGFQKKFVGKEIHSYLNLYDSDFKLIKNLVVFNLPSPFENKIKMVEECSGVEITDNEIIIGDTSKGFFLSTYSHKGEKIFEINKDNYKPEKVTEKWKERIISDMKRNPVIGPQWDMIKNKIYFPPNFPAYSGFSADPKGNILIRTYHEKDNQTLYILLNKKGEIIKEKFLTSEIESNLGKKHFALWEDRVFYLIESKDGNFNLVSEII